MALDAAAAGFATRRAIALFLSIAAIFGAWLSVHRRLSAVHAVPDGAVGLLLAVPVLFAALALLSGGQRLCRGAVLPGGACVSRQCRAWHLSRGRRMEILARSRCVRWRWRSVDVSRVAAEGTRGIKVIRCDEAAMRIVGFRSPVGTSIASLLLMALCLKRRLPRPLARARV